VSGTPSVHERSRPGSTALQARPSSSRLCVSERGVHASEKRLDAFSPPAGSGTARPPAKEASPPVDLCAAEIGGDLAHPLSHSAARSASGDMEELPSRATVAESDASTCRLRSKYPRGITSTSARPPFPGALVREAASLPFRWCVVGYDHEQIVVTFRARVAASRRTEEVDSLRSVRLDQASHDLLQLRVHLRSPASALRYLTSNEAT